MTDTIITYFDIQTDFQLQLEEFDRVIVTAGSGAYWSGVSGIIASPTALLTGRNEVSVYGTLDAYSVSAGAISSFLVGAQGAIQTQTGLLLQADSYLTNHGTISGFTGGSGSGAVRTNGGGSDIANFGSIDGIIGVVLGSNTDAGDRLNNMGLIYGADIGVQMRGPEESVLNSGTITGQRIGVDIYGEFAGAGLVLADMTLNNSGLIEGGTIGIRSSTTFAGSTLTILNSGTISSAGVAIQSTAGSDRITNSGTITGNIELGAGDDYYYGLGGRLNGILYGGAGSDNYYIDQPRIDIRETGGDIDTVFADCSFRLDPAIENLNLLGAGDFRGFGNAFSNVISGNNGNNRITGLDGNDFLTGEFGNDTLIGGSGTDSLDGGDGDDALQGGLANDTLRGGDGDDQLTGGIGRDVMFGSSGADSFVFASLGHTGATTTSADTLSDFERGEDQIELRAIDANANNAGSNDTFTFLGVAAFSNVAGQARVAQSGGNTFVELDVNGDSLADAMIRLNGLYTLNASDFAL